MAFVAVAAIAGGAEVTATLALAAIAEVGTAMTVIGAVTGNKDLMKIGGVMGLVGGIGGMMAGTATGAMDAAAASDAGGGAAMNSAADLGGDAAGSAMDAAAASDAGNGLINGAAPDAATSLNPTADMSVSPAATTTPVQSAPVTQSVATPQGAETQPAVTDVATQSGNLGPVGAQAPVTPADYQVGGRFGPDNMDVGGGWNPSTANAGSAPQSSGSFFSKFGDFVKNNKELVNTGQQLIGGALKGAADTDRFNQQMGLARDKFARANSVGTFSPQTGIIGRATA